MADVFVSYAREDLKRVRPLVTMLETEGYSVWWDRCIDPGREFEREIEAAMVSASCVVLILTRAAIQSHWVRAEVTLAQHYEKLIPVLLEDVETPLSLRALQLADLRRWPENSHEEARQLLSSVAGHTAAAGDLFVGRSQDMSVLDDAFDQAFEGSGGLVTVSGEPGIGKTRCIEEFAHLVEDQGVMVLWGRCYEQPGAPAYWPWVQILREYADANTDDALRVTLGAHAEIVAALVPEIGQRLGIEPHQVTAAYQSDNPFRLFDAISRVLCKDADNAPLVLILDDLHWADTSSLSLLEYLAKDIHRHRILIVCAYRDVEVTRKSPLLATLGELTRGVGARRVRLSGLDMDHTRTLTAAVAGISIPEAIMEAIHHQTDGNPLFVNEVAKSVAEEHKAQRKGPMIVDVPDGIREAIGRRLDRLSDTCNEILACASVLGREFDLHVVASALAYDLNDCMIELDRAANLGLVDQGAMPNDQRFTHAVIRETLYDELSTLERLQLHKRIAESLVKRHREHLEPVLSQVVHHFHEASALGNHDSVAEYALRAAAHEESVYGFEEAFKHYDIALAALLECDRERDPQTAYVYFRKGRIALSIGKVSDAIETLAQSIALAREFGDIDLFAQATVSLVFASSNISQQHTIPLLREALEMVAEDNGTLRATLLAYLAFALRTTGAVDEVEDVGSKAIALARQLNDPGVLAVAIRLTVMGLRGQACTLEHRLEFGREMMELAEHLADPEEKVELWYWQLLSLLDAGEIDAFVELRHRYAQHVTTYQLPRHCYQAHLLKIAVSLLRGQWEGLDDEIQQAFVLGEKLNRGEAEGVYGAQMFQLNRDLGRLQSMAPLVQRMIADGAGRLWAPGLMLMCCEVGFEDNARRSLEHLAQDKFSGIARDEMWLTCMVFCAETCGYLCDSDRAHVLYALIEPFSGQVANHPTAVCLGSVDTYLGILANVMGERGVAQQHFEKAIEKNRRMGAWPALIRCQIKLAQLYMDSDNAEEIDAAKQLIVEVESLVEHFGMDGASQIVRQLLDAGDTSFPDHLTSREVEVLTLLAMGRSNKDVARVLDISLSTVATHVRSILSKTGCANRTEAAAYAMRHDLNI